MQKLDVQQILKETSESVTNGHTIQKLEEWKKLLNELDKGQKKNLKYAIKILETVIKLKKKRGGNFFKKVYIYVLMFYFLAIVTGQVIITNSTGGVIIDIEEPISINITNITIINNINQFDQDLNTTDDVTFNKITVTTNLVPEVNNTGSVGLEELRWAEGFFTNLNVTNLGGLSPIRVLNNIIGIGFNFSADNFVGDFIGDGSEITNLSPTSPGGNDTQVQFNDGGSFGGDAGFTYNKSTTTLNVIGDLNQTEGNFTGNNLFGSMSNIDFAGVTIPLTVVGQFENITGLNATEENGFTFFNNTLVPQIAGRYLIRYSFSGTSAANSIYLIGVSVNNVIDNGTLSQTTIGAGGNVVNIGGGGIIDLNVGDFVNLQVADDNTPAQNIVYTIASVGILRVSE